MAGSGTRFVVKRLKWIENYDERWEREPGELAVSSFTTFEEADTERAKRENELRKKVNPFTCGAAVQYWSHLDEPRLRDWLMDHGITPPKANKDGITNWAEWWKKSGQKLGAEKRESVWEALDKVRFYVVREEPIRPIGYAVMALNWVYNDEFYDADSEGGRLIKVYRSRERAEAECQQLNEKERDAWSFVDEFASEIADEYEDDEKLEEEFAMFDMQERIRYRRGLARDEKLKKGEGLFRTTEGVPFYEVIEVELEGIE